MMARKHSRIYHFDDIYIGELLILLSSSEERLAWFLVDVVVDYSPWYGNFLIISELLGIAHSLTSSTQFTEQIYSTKAHNNIKHPPAQPHGPHHPCTLHTTYICIGKLVVEELPLEYYHSPVWWKLSLAMHMVVTIYKESSQKKIQEGHQLDKQRNLEKDSVIMKGRKMQAQQYDMEMEVWNEF